MIPALDAGVVRAREKGWLAHGPFEYGRFEKWFARQSGGDELPPKRRFKTPKLYLPPHRTYDMDTGVAEFLSLQDAYIETLQLASGVDLARVKVPSPAMSLLKLSLGQWLASMEGHQRRHLWQAREAIGGRAESDHGAAERESARRRLPPGALSLVLRNR